ncbi:hypothetical protein BJV78DRAFT_1131020 [Lactifluus subvellereus]|nr:hypothetical protein BJV78DRAFT_1131020 [Lactifluus subvellereus]
MATIGLPTATILYLTSGKADYLSSRYVSATWDLGEVERDWKEKIVAQNGHCQQALYSSDGREPRFYRLTSSE